MSEKHQLKIVRMIGHGCGLKLPLADREVTLFRLNNPRMKKIADACEARLEGDKGTAAPLHKPLQEKLYVVEVPIRNEKLFLVFFAKQDEIIFHLKQNILSGAIRIVYRDVSYCCLQREFNILEKSVEDNISPGLIALLEP